MRFSNNMYMMNNNLHKMIKGITYLISNIQNNISILSLFVILHETKYNQHNCFWYYRPSIMDPLTL